MSSPRLPIRDIADSEPRARENNYSFLASDPNPFSHQDDYAHDPHRYSQATSESHISVPSTAHGTGGFGFNLIGAQHSGDTDIDLNRESNLVDVDLTRGGATYGSSDEDTGMSAEAVLRWSVGTAMSTDSAATVRPGIRVASGAPPVQSVRAGTPVPISVVPERADPIALTVSIETATPIEPTVPQFQHDVGRLGRHERTLSTNRHARSLSNTSRVSLLFEAEDDDKPFGVQYPELTRVPTPSGSPSTSPPSWAATTVPAGPRPLQLSPMSPAFIQGASSTRTAPAPAAFPRGSIDSPKMPVFEFEYPRRSFGHSRNSSNGSFTERTVTPQVPSPTRSPTGPRHTRGLSDAVIPSSTHTRSLTGQSPAAVTLFSASTLSSGTDKLSPGHSRMFSASGHISPGHARTHSNPGNFRQLYLPSISTPNSPDPTRNTFGPSAAQPYLDSAEYRDTMFDADFIRHSAPYRDWPPSAQANAPSYAYPSPGHSRSPSFDPYTTMYGPPSAVQPLLSNMKSKEGADLEKAGSKRRYHPKVSKRRYGAGSFTKRSISSDSLPSRKLRSGMWRKIIWILIFFFLAALLALIVYGGVKFAQDKKEKDQEKKDQEAKDQEKDQEKREAEKTLI